MTWRGWLRRARLAALLTPLILPGAAWAGAAFPALTATDVDRIARAAARAVDLPYVIAVVDRGGNPLGVFDKPGAPATATGNFSRTEDAHELAVALARTAAFFTNSQAPLTSRTVRFISGIHFPPGIQNKPNAALYGIENTNRGCDFNATFNPDKFVPRARSLAGVIGDLPCTPFDQSGCGLGVVTGKLDRRDSSAGVVNPGGVPIFRLDAAGNPAFVGGVGVVGVPPEVAEFAAFKGATLGGVPTVGGQPNPFFFPRGFIYLDGIRLPGVFTTKRPAGQVAGSAAGLSTFFGPVDSPLPDGVPDGFLIGPTAGSRLSVAQVRRIVEQARDMANITRAAIRLPSGSAARMMISVADLDGDLLAVFRMPDATIFSIDVSVAKARNVVYFSNLWQGSARQAEDLRGVPGATAVTNRTISFGAQPLFPPGINGSRSGPFFNLYKRDVANPCSQGFQPPDPNQNGIVFFPGSTPLFRDGVPVGGLGVSGDGVEQDDLVSAAGATGFAPPMRIRADRICVRRDSSAPLGFRGFTDNEDCDPAVRLPYFKFNRNPVCEKTRRVGGDEVCDP
jgi:uncharacterized protein GlcG (DUF336 family)